MVRLRARMLMGTEPVQDGSLVELEQALPGSVFAGEMELVDLVSGEDLVFVELEEKLHVSVGDLTQDGIEVPSSPGGRLLLRSSKGVGAAIEPPIRPPDLGLRPGTADRWVLGILVSRVISTLT